MPEHHALYMSDVYQLVRNTSPGLVINWQLLKDNRLVKFGGSKPFDWCALKEKGYKLKPVRSTVKYVSQDYHRLVSTNGTADADTALAQAIVARHLSALLALCHARPRSERRWLDDHVGTGILHGRSLLRLGRSRAHTL